MSPTFLAKQWATLCGSAHATARQLGAKCSERAVTLQRQEVERFCCKPAPQTKEELERAYTHRTALAARLTAIDRADAIARQHPQATDEIFQEIASFCEAELPTEVEEFLDMQRRNLELNARISELCAAEEGRG